MWAFMLYEGGTVSRAGDSDFRTIEYDPFEKEEESDEVVRFNSAEECSSDYFERLRNSPLKMDNITGAPAIWAQEVGRMWLDQLSRIPSEVFAILIEDSWKEWKWEQDPLSPTLPDAGWNWLFERNVYSWEYPPSTYWGYFPNYLGPGLHIMRRFTEAMSEEEEVQETKAEVTWEEDVQELDDEDKTQRDLVYDLAVWPDQEEWNLWAGTYDDPEDVTPSYKREIKPYITQIKKDEYGNVTDYYSYPWHEQNEMKIIEAIDKEQSQKAEVDESTFEQIAEMHEQGMGVQAIAKTLQIDKGYVSRKLKELTSIKVLKTLWNQVDKEGVLEFFGTIDEEEGK
jgi:hypothetical protein